MSKNQVLEVHCLGLEIGRLSMDEDAHKSFFQYNPEFLKSGEHPQLFPLIFKRIPQTQVFSQFFNDSFRGLPSMIADSLPDAFGNTVFKTWLESKNKDMKYISPLEQLAYVANRGMGALEYQPAKSLPDSKQIEFQEIVEVLKLVLQNKSNAKGTKLNSKALLNIFKIGSSAGGLRPKILISEHKKNASIIPGDLAIDNKYNHYLVKLNLEDNLLFPKELIEFSYYQTAIQCGITMMSSKLIDSKHFATQRFDRQNGKKIHTLSASGISGWDYKDPEISSYEQLFKLASYLKIPYIEIEELYRRMIFNLVFCNHDDHLKNHAFVYDEKQSAWHLSPAYDITYSLNPELNFTQISRALSINEKRIHIMLKDVLSIAETYTIKKAKRIIEEIQDSIVVWEKNAMEIDIKKSSIKALKKGFKRLL